MRPPTRAALLCAGLALLAPACNKTTNGPARTKVAMVCNCTDPFWSIAEAGATKAGRDFNCDVVFRQPATNTVADQNDIVTDIVRRGVAGVAVSVIKPTDQAKFLADIAGQTILITVDNDSPGSNRRCYIGVNNYEAGKAAGRLVKQALPGGGTVALFIGNVSSANAIDRIGGVLDELAGAKDAPRTKGSKLGQYTLDDIYTDDTQQTIAQDKAKDVLERLQGTPNVACVGLYAYNPKAILLAARSKGLVGKVKIVGFDEDAVTLQGIRDGDIVGTVVQDPFQYGYKAVEVLAGLAKGDASLAVDVPIDYRIITQAGGPPEKHGPATVLNIKPEDFTAKLKADVASGAAAK